MSDTWKVKLHAFFAKCFYREKRGKCCLVTFLLSLLRIETIFIAKKFKLAKKNLMIFNLIFNEQNLKPFKDKIIKKMSQKNQQNFRSKSFLIKTENIFFIFAWSVQKD